MSRIFLLATGIAVMSQGAFAQTWTEVGDAGELVGTHQDTLGTGAMTTILGNLAVNTDAVDMYCIDIRDPLTFSATSSSPSTPLWLFDLNGNGVTSQEGYYLTTPSKITGSFVQTAGIYYLAISMHDTLAYNSSSLDIWNNAPRSVETIPNGAGAPGPLASWSAFGAVLGAGPYTITLTGTDYGNCMVPEPGSVAFLAGLVALGFASRRSRRR